MRYVRAELIRVIENKRFYIINLFVIIVINLQSKNIYRLTEEKQRLASGFWLQLLCLTLQDERIILFFAVISGTVYASTLREDAENRFYYPCFCRESRIDYIKGKIAVNFCAVNLTLLIACLVCVVKQYLFLSPEETLMTETKILDSLRQIIASGINYSLFNCFWGSFAMLVSYTLKSMYLAYLAPFIGFYFLVIANKQFFRRLIILNPYLWIQNPKEWYAGKYGQWLLLFMLCAAVNLVLAVIVLKRYEND